jgi:uncharacterized protein (TIRG00374 family)
VIPEPTDEEPQAAPVEAEPDEVQEELPPVRRRSRLRRLLPAPIWQVGRLLLLALIVEYLVVPQLAGPRKLITLISEVNPFLLLAGVGLEAAALICYSMLTRTVLPQGRHVPFWTLFRIQMTSLSISHCAPGGSATGTALAYRLMTRAGTKGGDVGFALATQAVGSAVVLNVILWLALVISIPFWGFSPAYLIAAVVAVVLLIAAGLCVFTFTRGEDSVGSILERAVGRVPFVDGVALRRSFVELAGRLRRLGTQPRLLWAALAWAAANWLLDAASLYVFVGAFGHWVNPDGLLVAYGLAYVLAAIPLTPGGLGVVEATLTGVLVGFGTPKGVAALGVVGYRLINFWLPIPLGGLSYLSLQVGLGGPRPRSASDAADPDVIARSGWKRWRLNHHSRGA